MVSGTITAELPLETRVFKGLADASRLAILATLSDGERSVGAIVARTGLGQPNVSTHLGCLLDCGLVTRTRHGQHMHYRVADPEIGALIAVARRLAARHAASLAGCEHDLDHLAAMTSAGASV